MESNPTNGDITNANDNGTTVMKSPETCTSSSGDEANIIIDSNIDKKTENKNEKAIAENDVESFIKNLRKRKLTDGEDDNCDVKLSKMEFQTLINRYKQISSKSKSPVQILQELFQKNAKKISITFKSTYDVPHEPIHVAIINIEDIGSFSGKARTKQMSKQYAAENFLNYLNDIFKEKENKKRNVKKKTIEQPVKIIEPKPEMMLDSNLVEKIIGETNKKIFDIINPENVNALIENTISDINVQNILKSFDLWRYKEYSAFLLESKVDNNFKVISIGTGCKCVKSEFQRVDGTIIRDCHAEIIARRSLVNLFYEQLELLFENNLMDKPEFIIEPVNSKKKYFRLKKHLRIHLFISSPPCGDGRTFNFNDNTCKNSKKSKGVLRVKIENGQGTVPMPKDYLSTWDGILMSEQRATIMSCSDKVSLWNIVGIQGSLLSYFIQPIYIESLVIYNLFNYENLLRSSYGRIDKRLTHSFKKNSNYKINEHKVGGLTNSILNKAKDSINISHNWFQSIKNPNNNLEIVKTDTGKNRLNDDPSRLCKKNLMKKFLYIVEKYPDINIIINPDDSYHDLKYRAIDYQKNKLALFTAFKESNLGTWVKAPNEYDLFSILDD